MFLMYLSDKIASLFSTISFVIKIVVKISSGFVLDTCDIFPKIMLISCFLLDLCELTSSSLEHSMHVGIHVIIT